jgi:glutaminyl-tRNA synthetase
MIISVIIDNDSNNLMDLQKYFNVLDPKVTDQLTPELLEKHLAVTGGKMVTRLPPEPNFLLHLGHAKAAFINFNFAKLYNGICYMRFDDTNPLKEKQEYVDSILEDILWMGHKPYKVTYTSDYFDQLYHYAIELIKKDKAYVCELDQETMQKQRYDGTDSPHRNRPIEESLKLFEEMKNGKHKENTMTLRLKGDMKDLNPNMRDLVAYRILFKEHLRTGDKWCIYPSYDYSHPIVDSLENITHSLCSMEFQVRNKLYRWIPETLGLYRPPQIEYVRLNVTHTLLSKRKLIELVIDKIVDGWDDPRLPTIKGLRRKGYTPEAINDFCMRVGISLGLSTPVNVNYELLEECLRQDLDTKAPRAMAIMDPLEVEFMNIPDWIVARIHALDFPNLKEKSPKHIINVHNIVYIERDDFRLVDSPKYYRLAPNKIVRLKYFGLIKCVNYIQVEGKIEKVYVELMPDDYKPAKRVQGTINWASAVDHVKIEVRKYSHLFTKEGEIVNGKTLEIINAMCDTSIEKCKPYDKYQFERIGYFSVDPDTTENKIVMNWSVGLKEDKGKMM